MIIEELSKVITIAHQKRKQVLEDKLLLIDGGIRNIVLNEKGEAERKKAKEENEFYKKEIDASSDVEKIRSIVLGMQSKG